MNTGVELLGIENHWRAVRFEGNYSETILDWIGVQL
jgi:hypothetical protein